MKLRILTSTLALLLVFHNAQAQELKGTATQADLDFANKNLVLTKGFGNFKTATVAKQSNGQLLIEYIPVSDQLENWTTMATLTIIPCTNNAQICGKLSQQIGNGILTKNPFPQFKKDLIDKEVWKSQTSQSPETANQTTFFHYIIGEGAIQETNVGYVFVTPAYNNIFQLQKRGKDNIREQEVNALHATARAIATEKKTQ